MKITITNTFHNSSTTINIENGTLTHGQVKRAEKKLCGISGCQCGAIWSSNHTDLGEGYENCHLEPTYNGNDVDGAEIVEG